ncbi:hypothetical protein ACBR55_07005 [Salinicoccus roseus]|uniref:hypothetical protein n=1 Tax=Salinicoccus roseus TaxID=45670 RepID=UPI00352487E5
MKSNFWKDSNNEKMIAKWLDKYFYPKVDGFENGRFSFVSKRANQFTTDEEKIQRHGIDIVYKTQAEKLLYVDEKAQLDYLNNNLPTFAFEIKFKNRSNGFSEGWFIREDLKTTHYLLVYPNSTVVKDAQQLQNFEDISSVELLLIEKDKLWHELKSRNVTKENLVREGDELIYKEKVGREQIKDSSSKDMYLYRTSPNVKMEEPINIIIKRKVLEKISDAIWMVDKNEIKEERKPRYYY